MTRRVDLTKLVAEATTHSIGFTKRVSRDTNRTSNQLVPSQKSNAQLYKVARVL